MDAEKTVVVLLVALLVLPVGGVFAEAGPDRLLTPTAHLQRVIPSISLTNEPLMRALARCEKLSGLVVEAEWGALKSARVTKETPVTLSAEKITVEKLLDLTLQTVSEKGRPLAWYLAGKTVHVSTQSRVLQRNTPYGYSLEGGAGRVARPEDSGPPVRRTAGAGGIPSLNFDEMPLNVVLEFLADVAGVNVHVNWKALEATGISKETRVTARARNVSVARALDMVLGQLNVARDALSSIYWVVEEGVVEISTGETLNRYTRTRVFPIGDLLMIAPNFIAPQIDIQAATNNTGNNAGTNNTGGGFGGGGIFTNTIGGTGTGTGTGTDQEENVAEQRKRVRETLIKTIKDSIGDEMWAPTGKGSITILRDKLIISQTPLGFKLLERSMGR